MRSKEEAHDYRYFPDPDLLPLELTQAYVDGLKKGLPELPDAKKARFMRDYKLSAYDAGVLVAERESAEFFEAVAQGARRQDGGQLGHQRAVRPPEQGGPRASPRARCRPSQLGGIIDLIASGAISGKIAKDVFEIVWSEGGDPAEIVEKRGLKQVTDTGAIETAVDAVIAANPDKVAAVQGQARHARLVRRPGHEIDRRQSQPAGRQRAAEEETGALTMSPGFQTIEYELIDDLCRLIREKTDGWDTRWYRGSKNQKYGLLPKLFRDKKQAEREGYLAVEFRRRAGDQIEGYKLAVRLALCDAALRRAYKAVRLERKPFRRPLFLSAAR